MTSWYMETQNVIAGRAQQEIRFPLNRVVRADGKFPYRPDIVSILYFNHSDPVEPSAHALACPCQVCPKPERRYEAQIGLKAMEEQAVRTAAVPQHMAKLVLEALASRVEAHFAHLRSPLAVANCDLCRTSRAGQAIIDRALAVTSTHAAALYPTHSSVPRAAVRAPIYLSDGPLENTTQVSHEPLPELGT